MDPLKLAFDAKRLFHNREGLGTYARTLVADLQTLYPQHEYYLLTPSISTHSYCAYFLDETKFKIVTAQGKNAWYWRSRGMVKNLKANEIDIYWGLSNELPFGIAKSAIKSVVTIHDMIYRTFPQQFSQIDRWIYHRKFSNAIQSADLIMATSENTRRDITEYFPTSQSKIKTVYQSVSPSYRNVPASRQKGQHFLVVGTINERKNLDLVVEAYHILESKDRRPVIVVGSGKAYLEKMKSKIARYALEDWFQFVGQVSTEKLIELYQGALGLLFPSLYEGFGIPIVEAMMIGIPVIGNNVSSIPEVMGKYGIIIEYDSIESLKAAILKLSQSDSVQDGKSDKEHLNRFKHDTIGQAIMQNLELVKQLS